MAYACTTPHPPRQGTNERRHVIRVTPASAVVIAFDKSVIRYPGYYFDDATKLSNLRTVEPRLCTQWRYGIRDRSTVWYPSIDFRPWLKLQVVSFCGREGGTRRFDGKQ